MADFLVMGEAEDTDKCDIAPLISPVCGPPPSGNKPLSVDPALKDERKYRGRNVKRSRKPHEKKEREE